MRSKLIRAGAALFIATAAFVPAHLASASSDDSNNEDVSGFQCPADQALFDQIKAWIVEFGPLLGDPSQADPALQGQIELLASLALLSDSDLCATLTGGDGGGDTSTTEPESTTSSTTDESHGHETIKICHATGNPENPYVELTVDANGLNGHGNDHDDLIPAPEEGCPGPTTSTTGETTSTTAEETTSTTAEETTSTTAEETTSTTAATTSTTAATTSTTAATTSTTGATTSTTAATTSTTGATSTTQAHSTTDPTVGGVVVTSSGTLPRTGGDPAPLVALGSLTAGLGFFLLFVRRRFVS